MSARRSKADALRLRVPDLFKGDYSQVLISTFGIDIEFYERVLRRDFAQLNHQVVLIDTAQLSRSITGSLATGNVRHLNRTWLAVPVRTNGSAHAKFVLLAGAEDGLLLVGSGNMSISGYAGPGECFSAYRWSAEEPNDFGAFAAMRQFTTGLSEGGLIDATASERVDAFWSAQPWLRDEPKDPASPVRHNLDVPLGEQFVEAVAGEPVEELLVSAPFFDRDCRALVRLAQELEPKRVRVMLQPRRASVDPARLEDALNEINGEIYSIVATDDPDAYLHAKILVARTKKRSICLTGSANCSVSALWLRPPQGNIEIGNLLSGDADVAAHLFEPAAVTIAGPLSVPDLHVAFRDDESDEQEAALHLADLRWDPPNLRCHVSVVVESPADVDVLVRGATVAASISLTTDNGGTQLLIELHDPTIIESNDAVTGVMLRIKQPGEDDAITTGLAVPYHVPQLQAQERRTVDADRLRRAAQLELDDPDLETALAALEEILIGDPTAPWREPATDSESQPDADASTLSWNEIDWTKVRGSQRYRDYESLGAAWQARPSDLALYLEALSRALRDLADPDGSPDSTQPGFEEDVEEQDPADGGLEGASVDNPGEPSDEDDQRQRRRQSATVRNLRLIRNFVRRNLAAIEEPAFRSGVGPGVVIPNAVILNWVCWWAATKSPDHPGELIDERFRLWRVMWGDEEGADSYLDELDDESRQHALDLFEQFQVSPVTLASFIDAWTWLADDDYSRIRTLRDTLRRACVHFTWQVGHEQIGEATNLVNARPTTVETYAAETLAEQLLEIASTSINDDGARTAIASAAHVDDEAVAFSLETVAVGPKKTRRTVAQATIDPGIPIDVTTGQEALAAWMGATELPYYRLKWSSGLAFYDQEADSGWIHDTASNETRDVVELEREYPQWFEVLGLLLNDIEDMVSAAA